MKEEKSYNKIVYDDIYKMFEWAKVNFSLNYNKYNDPSKITDIYCNYIYFAHLGCGVGSEQAEDRPVLIVDCYKSSSVCVIIPITLERLDDSRPYHIDLSNGKGTVLIEQIRTISKSRIYEYVYYKNKYATINEDDRAKINEQLNIICSLKPLYKKE